MFFIMCLESVFVSYDVLVILFYDSLGVSFSLSCCENIFFEIVNVEWGGNNFIVGGLML